jgi:hypothetical protein
MAKGSFRAVPGKVRRFVEFVGADLPTDRLDRHQWRSWVRHLKIEVEERAVPGRRGAAHDRQVGAGVADSPPEIPWALPRMRPVVGR